MTKLLDQFGQPIDRATLSQPQTAQLSALHLQVAGHPARGITPSRLNAILEAAELGDITAQHELFSDMEERDGHVFSELSKRKRAVIKLNWDIVPPRNATKQEVDATAYVKELLQDLTDFEDLQFDALDGISHGFSALELEWQRIGSDWTVQGAHHRSQTWFQLDQATRTQLCLRDNMPTGQALQPFGWLLHIHRAKSGYTARSGLSRVLVWPYLFKHFSVGDLAEFLDIYGLPLRIGKFPSQATEEEKATLWRAVAGIGHNAAGIIPASMAIEFQEAARGSEKPFQAMIDWCEKTQSKAITGSTLGMDSGRGGLGEGLSNIQNEIRLDIRDSDCKQLAGTITRSLIYPLLAINKGWADIRRCPRFVYDTLEAEDLKTYADSLPKLVSIGMQIPSAWAHEKLRIPLPADQDAVLSTQASQSNKQQEQPAKADPAPATKDKRAALAALRVNDGSVDVNKAQDAIDSALANTSADLQTQAEAWLAPAITAIAQAANAKAALELLASQNPLVDDNILTEAIARAMFVVELVGADSAVQELDQ
jgi:phage gp29-like protein